jgi:adenylate cyclase
VTGERVERRLAAILAADVAGYSRLMSADEVGTLAALKSHRRELIDPAIAAHKGRIVKTTGDGLLVEFASAVDAVNCAMAMQNEMRARNAGATLKITFRIGINIGDIIIDSGDIFGDGVNVAARIENECEPGGVFLSDDVHRQVRGRTAFEFDDLGERSLKNIDRLVRIFSVRASASAPAARPGPPIEPGKPPPLPENPSIAVLPFQNMSGDPEQEYFADGIVEDIITALSRFPSLFVIARNSCFTYKGRAVDVRQVGRELGVRYVLEGSVRKAGGRIRITAQLIDASSNKHLWAEKLDGDLIDLFELQDTLTTKIVSSVSVRLERAELERVKAKTTVDLDAYELFQKGMALQRYERGYDEAYKLFCRAFALDPSFAAAYVMAAAALWTPHMFQGSPLPQETRAEIVRLAGISAALPHEDASTMARAAHLLAFVGRQYDLGMELADRAVALNPSLGFAWLARGLVYVTRGEGQPAIDSFSTLLRLDPLDPARPTSWAGLACAYCVLGEYDKGYEWARKAADALPVVFTLAYLVINAVPSGRLPEARETVARMLQLKPGLTVPEVLELCCHSRDQEWLERMRDAFIKAGLPE